MIEQWDLCVVGAGIAGLTLALAAARRGLTVVVVERDKDRSFRRQGFNLVVDDSSASLLREHCDFPDPRLKYDHVCDLDPLGVMPLTVFTKGSWLLAKFLRVFGAVKRGAFRDELIARSLEAGVELRYDHHLTAVWEPSEDASAPISAEFSNNRVIKATIVAGCDGMHSKTRNLICKKQLSGCGAVCIRGAALDDGSLHRLARVPNGSPLLLFVSCQPGTGFNCTVLGGVVTFVMELQHDDAAGLARSDPAVVRGTMQQRMAQWHPVLQQLVSVRAPLHSLHVEPLYDLGIQDGCEGKGRVTVLGDAAHPVMWTGPLLPRLGSGQDPNNDRARGLSWLSLPPHYICTHARIYV